MINQKPDWALFMLCMWVLAPAISLLLVQVSPYLLFAGPVASGLIAVYILRARRQRSNDVTSIRKPDKSHIGVLSEALECYWDKEAVAHATKHLDRLLPQMQRDDWFALTGAQRSALIAKIDTRSPGLAVIILEKLIRFKDRSARNEIKDLILEIRNPQKQNERLKQLAEDYVEMMNTPPIDSKTDTSLLRPASQTGESSLVRPASYTEIERDILVQPSSPENVQE